MAKQSNSLIWLVALVAVFLLIGGGLSSRIDFSNIDIVDALSGGGAQSNLVDVDKVVDFSLKDEYGGSALTSKTLLVYDGTGLQQLHSLTTGGDGTIATPDTYKSGEVLYVYYESSNDKMWWKVTVPQMTPADAQSATVNTIKLNAFAIGTYTSDSLYYLATSISDADTYDAVTSETPTFTYSLSNTGSDNTGIKSSYDPLYQMPYNVVMYVTFSGTSYETILVYGFTSDYTLGSTHYVARNLDPYALTKHKIANRYLSEGTQSVTFSLDLTGYVVNGTTMQINVYAYSDPAYSMSHGGAYGTEAVIIAEQTVTIIRGS